MKPTKYRIFIRDRTATYYLMDVIVCNKRTNPVLNTEPSRAMVFWGFKAAKGMSDRLKAAGYEPHIQQIGK